MEELPSPRNFSSKILVVDIMKICATSSFLIGKSKDPESLWKIKKLCFKGNFTIRSSFLQVHKLSCLNYKELKEWKLMFRLVSEQLQPMKGLQKLRKWIEDCRFEKSCCY